MAELLIVLQNELNKKALKRERVFRDRNNPLEIFDDLELIRRYRFPSHSIRGLVNLCAPLLTRKTNRNNPLPPILQITTALRFYAKGVFQVDCGDTCGLSQSSISRSISIVTNILCEYVREFIRFHNSVQDINITKAKFYEIKKFPNIIGLIDGTHIKFQPPSKKEENLYVCRKGGHSINTQIISDADMCILDLVARFPGTTHDAYIWNQCSLREKFLSLPPNGYLLGDSGYGIEPFLMTPLLKPQNDAEKKYNEAHTGTRRIVENCIGLLKSVFRCLDTTGGKLLYKPEKVCKIIVACCVLHNIRRKLRLMEDNEFIVQSNEADDEACSGAEENFRKMGHRVRQEIINKNFTCN